MSSVHQQINQSLLLVPKTETSQHNPYESKFSCFMNVNEVTMPQYKSKKNHKIAKKFQTNGVEMSTSQF